MKIIILSILMFTSLLGFSYQDVTWKHEYQNVLVRVKTGSTIIEIRNKAIILARLAHIAADEIGYTKKIIININHDYSNRDSSKALVGYTKEDIYTGKNYPRKRYSNLTYNRKCLRIYLRIRDIDYEEAIQIIEQSVQSINILKSKDYSYKDEGDRTSHLIDIQELPELENDSDISDKVLCEKVNRTIGDGPYDMSFSTSYYYECGAYHLYGLPLYKKYGPPLYKKDLKDRKDTLVLATVPSIFQVKRFDKYSAIVFDTDSTFYFLKNFDYREPTISKRHSLSPTHGNYMPFEVTKVDDYVFIQFGGFLEGGGTFNRLLAYIIKEDKLIQDVKSKIENN